MSTIKSSSADLTLNADGSGNDIKFQSNASEVGSLTAEGLLSTTTVTASGVVTGATVEATGDTSAGDNAAIGYTATEGLILTGQGSTDDVTIKNDADTTVLNVATGSSDIEISAGDLIFGTAGKGICLGVTSNTDANTLDDYEEGTFTPTLVTGTLSGSTGFYTKIGKMCHFQINISNFSDKTTDAAIIIQGLPFTQGIASAVGSVITYQVGNANVMNIVTGSTTQFYLRYAVNASSWASLKHNTLGGDPNLHLVGAYRTT